MSPLHHIKKLSLLAKKGEKNIKKGNKLLKRIFNLENLFHKTQLLIDHIFTKSIFQRIIFDTIIIKIAFSYLEVFLN